MRRDWLRCICERYNIVFRTLTLAAAVTMSAGSLSAATMQVVYSGTVSGSNDSTDYFGTGGSSLDGLSYVATFVYSTTRGSDLASSPDYQQLFGNASGAPSPILSATLSINGVDFLLQGQSSGYEYRAIDPTYSVGQSYAYDYSDDAVAYDYRYVYDMTYDNPGVVPVDVTSPYSSTNALGGTGYFSFYRYEYGSGLAYNISGILSANSVVATDITATNVPLPAAGILLVGAVGGLSLVRRRKSA